jgi:hypothetical protein
MDHSEDDALENAELPVSKGLDRDGLKLRMKRFARVRAAERVLPSTIIHQNGLSEERVAAARERLTRLGSDQTPDAADLAADLVEIDEELDLMATAVLARCDGVEFSVLRSTTLRALANHRSEVLSLLEVLLEDSARALARLPKIEYLITILSTEEVQDRRAIVHDPVGLTPLLAAFDVASSDPSLMNSIAMELYQAANSDDSGPSINDLRQLRNRKAQLGLQTLNPIALRAVVTYNARMFNRFEDLVAAARASDADLESLIETVPDQTNAAAQGSEMSKAGVLGDDDEIWASIGRRPECSSVFDSSALDQVIAAARRRLKKVPIGSCSSERVALTLDMSVLEPIEIDAILTTGPDDEQGLLAHTAMVGLILRDLGAVRSDLLDLHVDLEELTGAWVEELSVAFGKLVSKTVADAENYAIAGTLSSIKAKHLMSPLNAHKNAVGRAAPKADTDAAGTSDSRALKELAREAVTKDRNASAESSRASETLRGRWEAWSSEHQSTLVAALASILLVLAFAGANVIGTTSSTVDELASRELSKMSPHLKSAYRSQNGNGPLLVGRVGNTFVRLTPKEQLAAAESMRAQWNAIGVREVMVYDNRNRLQIYFADGAFRRPKL